MKPLIKDDFSCWGDADEYDDELIITHHPKIHSKTIADQILKNQKIIEDLRDWIMTTKRDNYNTSRVEFSGAKNARVGCAEEVEKILGEEDGTK